MCVSDSFICVLDAAGFNVYSYVYIHIYLCFFALFYFVFTLKVLFIIYSYAYDNNMLHVFYFLVYVLIPFKYICDCVYDVCLICSDRC